MINMKGVLVDASNKPISGAKIILRSVKNGSVPTGIEAEVTTDENGAYDFSANVGSYLCYIFVEGKETALPGYVNIYDFSGEGTLQEYLYAPCEKDARPMFIYMWEIVRQEIKKSADEIAKSEENIESMLNQIKSLVSSGNIFNTKEEGLEAVEEGEFFVVVEPSDGLKGASLYQKVNDQAVLKNEIPNYVYVVALKERVNEVAAQVDGFKSRRSSKYLLAFSDSKGRIAGFFDKIGGVFNALGGIKAKSVDSPEARIQRINSNMVNNKYSIIEIDKNGKVVWGTRAGGWKEYRGEPLHNTRGLLKGRAVAIGDSITRNGARDFFTNSDGLLESSTYLDLSWHVRASMILDGSMFIESIYATGRMTTKGIHDTHLPQAIALKPDMVIVMCGRNDVITNGISIENETIPYLKKIYAKLRYNGILPVICSQAAQNNSGSETRRIRQMKIDKFNRAYALKHGLPFVDIHTPTTDPKTGDWFEGFTNKMPDGNPDPSHPNTLGAGPIALALAETLRPWLSNVKAIRSSENLTYPLSNNYVVNPMFLRDGDSGSSISGWNINADGSMDVESQIGIKGKAAKFSNGRRMTQKITLTDPGKYCFGFAVKGGGEGANLSVVLKSGESDSSTYLGGIAVFNVEFEKFQYYYTEFILGDEDSKTVSILATNGGPKSAWVTDFTISKLGF